ncbi:MAG TPA: hypothetical protein VJG32_19970, partial [Anaerolineae bacterium]|nr:hypothetical protein [Anaerolineae bacterium]
MSSADRSVTLDLPAFLQGLDVMRRIGQAINAGLDPSALILEIYKQTDEAIPADVFALSLLLANPALVDLFAVDRGRLVRQPGRPIGPLTRWVVERRQPFQTANAQNEPPPV